MRIAIPSNASQGLATSLIVRTTLSVGRFCLVGVILALGVPAIAWLEQSRCSCRWGSSSWSGLARRCGGVTPRKAP